MAGNETMFIDDGETIDLINETLVLADEVRSDSQISIFYSKF